MDYSDLKEFATARQCQVIDALQEHGSQSKAAKALDINSRTLERSLQAVKRQASRRGWSPDHDMTHSVPDTHVAKGMYQPYYDLQIQVKPISDSGLSQTSRKHGLEG